MSMEHKAFLFDTECFHSEIEVVINECCKGENIQYAVKYIDNNYSHLCSPYTGESLDEKWRNEVGSAGIQQYIDFILTSCYDPLEDNGLSYSWDGLLEALKAMDNLGDVEEWILGKPVVCNGVTIDPGAMGLGIVEQDRISGIRGALKCIKPAVMNLEDTSGDLYELEPEEIIDAYNDLCSLYEQAESEKKGLLFTF